MRTKLKQKEIRNHLNDTPLQLGNMEIKLSKVLPLDEKCLYFESFKIFKARRNKMHGNQLRSYI